MHISENQGSNLEPSPEEKSGYIFRKIFLFKIGPGEKKIWAPFPMSFYLGKRKYFGGIGAKCSVLIRTIRPWG